MAHKAEHYDKEFFDEEALQWDEKPRRVELAKAIADARPMPAPAAVMNIVLSCNLIKFLSPNPERH